MRLAAAGHRPHGHLMGARLLADWLTTRDALDQIAERHEAVAELVRDAPPETT